MAVSPRPAQSRLSYDFSLREKGQSIGAAPGLVEGDRCVATAEWFLETTAELPASSVMYLEEKGSDIAAARVTPEGLTAENPFPVMACLPKFPPVHKNHLR